MSARKNDYLKPINLGDDLWCYADDKRLEIVVGCAAQRLSYWLTWKRLDRLRKQAAEARSKGEYKP